MRISVRARLTLARLRKAGEQVAGRAAARQAIEQDFRPHPAAVKTGPAAAPKGLGMPGGDGSSEAEKATKRADGDIEEN